MASWLAKGKWRWARHLELLDRKFMDMWAGRAPDRLMVFMPPRHGKSEYCSHRVPAWSLSNYPDKNVIVSGYGQDFAQEWGRKVRNTITEHSGQLGVKVASDSSSASRWGIDKHGGQMYAVGIGGALTGRGGYLLVCDDPIKNEQEARSEVYRERNWDWWRNVFTTRLEPNGKILLIMTRWHDDDLAGRLIKQERNRWSILNLAALAEREDELGRAEGEALWPDRYDVEALEAQRESMGDIDFTALYQGRPSLEQGNIIKYEWWNWYLELPSAPAHLHLWHQCWVLHSKPPHQT